jgi:2-dehydropantoate 2-reductase
MILGTDALHKGEETSYTRKGIIHFGDADGNNGEREEAIAEFFTRTGVGFALESDMKRMFWYKYMMNVSVNQVTAVLRIPYGAIQSNGASCEIKEARFLIEKAMREVIAVANAEGIGLSESDIESSFGILDQLGAENFTSMCQDVLAGRKTELEMFSPVVMELARKHGIFTPVVETLYLQLRVIERRLLNA